MKRAILVGAGTMGRAWLKTVGLRDDVDIVAVSDVFLDAATSATQEYALDVPLFVSAEEALRTVEADFVLNVTLPEAHSAVSTAALRAGVPVLSEKPVTPTVREALALAGLSEVTGVLFAASQSRRYSAGMRTFRAALQENGGAEQLTTRFYVAPRFGGFRDKMEHPLLVDMAIHTFDQGRYLLGGLPTSVYCRESNPSWSWYRGDANAEAIFSFEGNRTFSYSGSWCADGLPTSWNGEWRASFRGGSSSWDGQTSVLLQQAKQQVQELPLNAGLDELDATLDEFVCALDGGPEPWGEIHRNVWSLAMVEAAVESSRCADTVRFPDLFATAHAAALADAEPDVAAALRSWSSPMPREQGAQSGA